MPLTLPRAADLVGYLNTFTLWVGIVLVSELSPQCVIPVIQQTFLDWWYRNRKGINQRNTSICTTDVARYIPT